MGCLLKVLNENSDLIIALAGLVVSICALGFTAYQAWLSRMHNKLSVKPSLTTWSDTSYDAARGCCTYETTLMNAGLGPAYIKSYEILIDGEAVPSTTFNDLHRSIVTAFPHIIFLSEECYYGLLRKTHVLAANEETVIGRLVMVTSGIKDNDVQRLNVRVVYQSAYGDEQVYDSRSHLDFGAI